MEFLACFGYLVLVGALSNVFAAMLPRRWFRCDALPYRLWHWEKRGKIYEKLAIRRWKDRVPDMSRLLPGMVSKRVRLGMSAGEVERLAQETCISEFTHNVLILFGLRCLSIWDGAGGVIITLVWVLIGNLPCIIIQRYNRPRLLTLAQSLRLKHAQSALPMQQLQR